MCWGRGGGGAGMLFCSYGCTEVPCVGEGGGDLSAAIRTEEHTLMCWGGGGGGGICSSVLMTALRSNVLGEGGGGYALLFLWLH